MQLRYNEEAKDAGIHIIGACGFDSIPVDCGIEYMRENFQGNFWVFLDKLYAAKMHNL